MKKADLFKKYNVKIPTRAEFRQRCKDETVLEDPSMPKHRHRWYNCAYSGPIIMFRCSVQKNGQQCRCTVSRLMTKEESAFYKKHYSVVTPKSQKKDRDVHVVWHDFTKKFKNDYNEWKFTGFDFMTRVRKWADKQSKEHVQVLNCDDGSHSSSLVVLISHRAEKQYMGVTAVVIPQNCGPPAEFFLYPSHLSGFISALRQEKKVMRSTKKVEKAHRRELERAWKNVMKGPFEKV